VHRHVHTVFIQNNISGPRTQWIAPWTCYFEKSCVHVAVHILFGSNITFLTSNKDVVSFLICLCPFCDAHGHSFACHSARALRHMFVEGHSPPDDEEMSKKG